MEVWHPVSVKLDVTERYADLLNETIEQFRNANHVVGRARNNESYIITCKRVLHERTNRPQQTRRNRVSRAGILHPHE